ncbi:hypothetical protein [uncultured Arcobacter sp.]|nr:hypothetical protein [uncultured Arcobacter sp.]
MFDKLELENVATAHALELNKSIDKIAQNVLIGLALIALATAFRKR